MLKSQSIMDVTNIVRHFLQNDAQTLKVSKGKILSDKEFDKIAKTYLKVG